VQQDWSDIMAKCKRCGKKRLFLKLDSDGLCSYCAAVVAEDKRFAEIQRQEREAAEREQNRQELEHKIRSEMQQEIETLRKASYQKDNTVESDLSENKIPFPPHTSVIKYNDCDINKSIHNDGMNKQLNIAEKYDIDYVQAVGGCCCPECAKYRLRIYCISGSDTRFPKLPEYIKKYSWHCGLLLYPFSLGVNYMRLSENKSLHEIDELIEYSNRPFVDDRADEEIGRYNRILAKNKQDYIDGLNKEQARQEYEKIVVLLPDIAPKSQGGYMRMKKSNSANFQKLKENAVSVGIEIKDIIT